MIIRDGLLGLFGLHKIKHISGVQLFIDFRHFLLNSCQPQVVVHVFLLDAGDLGLRSSLQIVNLVLKIVQLVRQVQLSPRAKHPLEPD